MLLHHIAGRLFNTPLLATADYAGVVATAIADRLNVEPLAPQAALDAYKRPRRSIMVDKARGIAVVPIVGGLRHRGDFDAESGGIGYTGLQNQLAELVVNNNIRGVLLDFDSPGGEVSGIAETAAALRDFADEKPIWSIANSLCASAAFWLASSTPRIIATPNARVGSIGVVVLHQDVSQAMEKRGVVSTFIHAGRHKVDGNAYEPLPDEVRARIQSELDEIYDAFAEAVAEGRDMTPDEVKATEAAVYGPCDALENGFVDGIATLGETLSDFGSYLDSRGAPHVRR